MRADLVMKCHAVLDAQVEVSGSGTDTNKIWNKEHRGHKIRHDSLLVYETRFYACLDCAAQKNWKL